MDGDAYIAEILARYREQKSLADRAIAQLGDEAFFARLDSGSNSLATIVKHVSGNLRSRWTAFFTSDGEKPDRRRDDEFEEAAGETRGDILARWETAWSVVLDTLATLGDAEMGRMVTIRGEPHATHQAISRNLTHTAQHVGQIVFLGKHLAEGSWKTLSIPRGQSEEFNRRMREGR